MTIWGLGKRGSHPLPRHFIGSGCDGNGSRRQKQKIASAQFLRFMFKSVYFQKRGLPFPFRGIKSATRSRVSLLKRPGHETARCPAPSKCPRSAPGAFLERPRGAARNARTKGPSLASRRNAAARETSHASGPLLTNSHT